MKNGVRACGLMEWFVFHNSGFPIYEAQPMDFNYGDAAETENR